MINLLNLNLKNKGESGAKTIKEYFQLTEEKLNELINNLYHKPNEVFIADGFYSGCLTMGETWILFTVPTPKLLDKISSASITGIATIRYASGGYILQQKEIDSIGIIEMNRKKDNQITFLITLNEKASFSNNSALSIELMNCRITFS